MKTYVRLKFYIVEFLEREMFQREVVGRIKTHVFMFNAFFTKILH